MKVAGQEKKEGGAGTSRKYQREDGVELEVEDQEGGCERKWGGEDFGTGPIVILYSSTVQ